MSNPPRIPPVTRRLVSGIIRRSDIDVTRKLDDMIMRDSNATQHGNKFDETTWLGHVGASAVKDRTYLLGLVKDLAASCEEFLPILERQLQSFNPDGAAEESKAFQFACARVERMRQALHKVKA